MSDLYLLEHKINQSKAIIQRALSLCSKPYLALSFGKDSLAMMDIVTGIEPQIKCLFLSSEETMLLDNYEQLIAHYTDAGVNLQVVTMRHLDHDFEYGANNEFTQSAFFDGWDGVFMGLRIDESKARRMSLIAGKNNVLGRYTMRYVSGPRAGMIRCCPMAQWTGFETWLYCQERGLKMLDSYRSYQDRSSAQMPYANNARQVVMKLKQRNVSAYNRLMIEIPGLKMYD